MLLRDFEAYDTHSASPQPAPTAGRAPAPALPAGDRRARRLPLHRPGADHRGHGRPPGHAGRALDPAGAASAPRAPPLAGLIAEFAGMLNQRGEALAARLTAAGRTRRRRGRRLPAAAVDQPLAERCWRTGPMPATSIPEALYAALRADGRRVRHLHRADAAAERLPGLSPRRPAAQLRAGGRRPAPVAVGGAGADGDRRSRCRNARLRRARRADHRPLDPARARASC